MTVKILEVNNLSTYFYSKQGVVHAVDNLSFCINSAECLGIVGESGSGKSVTGLSIMKLVDPPGKIVSGTINLKGRNLLTFSEKSIREIRGLEISMIFQDPLSTLNPVFTVGKQIADVLKAHLHLSQKEAYKRVIDLFNMVGIPDAKYRFHSYPFELSGGLRQRVLIGMALSCNPSLVIADEPTTALDVSVQAQILNLMKDLKDNLRFSSIFISHDLDVVSQVADVILVMYAGKCFELATKELLLKEPKHPYTVALFDTIPTLESERKNPLKTIEGELPDLVELPKGCYFYPRCKMRTDICLEQFPPLQKLNYNHFCACHQLK